MLAAMSRRANALVSSSHDGSVNPAEIASFAVGGVEGGLGLWFDFGFGFNVGESVASV
jgi:hypothetical protein